MSGPLGFFEKKVWKKPLAWGWATNLMNLTKPNPFLKKWKTEITFRDFCKLHSWDKVIHCKLLKICTCRNCTVLKAGSKEDLQQLQATCCCPVSGPANIQCWWAIIHHMLLWHFTKNLFSQDGVAWSSYLTQGHLQHWAHQLYTKVLSKSNPFGCL